MCQTLKHNVMVNKSLCIQLLSMKIYDMTNINVLVLKEKDKYQMMLRYDNEYN